MEVQIELMTCTYRKPRHEVTPQPPSDYRSKHAHQKRTWAYLNVRPKGRRPGSKESINQTGHVPNHLEKAQLRTNPDQPGVPAGVGAKARYIYYLV